MKFSKLQVKFIVLVGVICLFTGVGITSMVSAAIINSSNHTVYIQKELTTDQTKAEDSVNPKEEVQQAEQETPKEPKKIVPEEKTVQEIPKEAEKETEKETEEYTGSEQNDEFDRVAYRFKGSTIQAIMNNPGSFDQETLNQAFTDYISKSNDIGAIFTAIDLLSTETIDQIAKDYIKNTNDYGIFYSLQDYLSDAEKKELQKIVDQNIGSMNQINNNIKNY